MPNTGALPLRRLIRAAWRKAVARGLTASDAHARLDFLYAMPDPWNLASPREKSRFEQTLHLLESRVGRVDTLLEIGCGEGHQSQHLARLCDRLYGIDISPRAVARAGARVPDGTFAVAEAGHPPPDFPDRFDLVTACEVLYYISDIPGTLARMNELGSACLVTFFGPAARVVAPHLEGLAHAERGWFFHDPYPWLFAFWHNTDTLTSPRRPDPA